MFKKVIHAAPNGAAGTTFTILFAISLSHFLNDTLQSVIPAIYPVIKESFQLNYSQIGLITFTFQMAASLLQPVVGFSTDKKPQPYSLATGMGFTLTGLLILSQASSFAVLLFSVGMIGIGSSIFHPEASRVAHMAAGKRRGLAQSIFQVGGNLGSSIGPILAALIVVPYGRGHLAWFSLIALLAVIILTTVGKWYQRHLSERKGKSPETKLQMHAHLSRKQVFGAIAILLVLIFSKYFYMASMSNYFTFYLIDKFHLSVRDAQLHLSVFLFSVAAGTLLGGPIGDRYGRKYVIWGSILGVAPFSLLLPHVGLMMTTILVVIIGMVLASAFSAILVYAQELLPGRLGLVSGLFFGFAFGMGALGSAVLGKLADLTSIGYVYQVCAFLPLIGLLAAFLPNIDGNRH